MQRRAPDVAELRVALSAGTPTESAGKAEMSVMLAISSYNGDAAALRLAGSATSQALEGYFHGVP